MKTNQILELKKQFDTKLVDLCAYLGLLDALEKEKFQKVEDIGFEIVEQEDEESIVINNVIFKEL